MNQKSIELLKRFTELQEIQFSILDNINKKSNVSDMIDEYLAHSSIFDIPSMLEEMDDILARVKLLEESHKNNLDHDSSK